MKIDSLYISAFGKFKDYRLSFNDSLNLFYGENENGKSTLLAFIKMMFYGSSGKGNDISKNPRKKYLPWDSSHMAGSIDFTHDGKAFRIERSFGASNSSDKITLIDLSDGSRQNFTGTTDLGAKFFNLSAQAFERCAFIASFGAINDDSTAAGELNSRLSSLIVSGEEDVSEKQVASRLILAKEELMSKGGKVGRYDKNKQKLIELNNLLAVSRQAENDREALALKIENQKKRLTLVNKEIDRTKTLLKATENSRSFRKLKDFIEASSQLSVVEKKLKRANGELIDISALNTVEQKLSSFKLLNQTLPELKSQLADINSQIAASRVPASNEALDLVKEKILQLEAEKISVQKQTGEALSQIESLEKLKQENLSKKPKINPVFLALAFIFAVSGVIFFNFNPVFTVISLILGVIFAVFSLVLRKKTAPLGKKEAALLEEALKKTNILSNKQAELKNELDEQKNIQNALFEQFKKANSLTAQKLQNADILKEKIEKGEEEVERIKEFFIQFFENENLPASISGIEIALHAYKDYLRQAETAKTKIAMLKSDLGEDITPESAAVRINEINRSDVDDSDPQKLEEYLLFKQKEANEITKSIAYDEAVARTDFSSLRHPTDIEHEIADTEKSLAAQKQFCDSIDIAAKALASAFAKTRKTFSDVLEKRTAEIFSLLTNNGYNAVNVSKEFSLAVESREFFGSKVWQYLSAGTIDQAYFALRLALSELLSKDCKGLPILIDDAFCQYDDTRVQTAMEFLKEYSKTNQVIFFTCRKSVFKNSKDFKDIT